MLGSIQPLVLVRSKSHSAIPTKPHVQSDCGWWIWSKRYRFRISDEEDRIVFTRIPAPEEDEE